jgi:hypothetical protein
LSGKFAVPNILNLPDSNLVLHNSPILQEVQKEIDAKVAEDSLLQLQAGCENGNQSSSDEDEGVPDDEEDRENQQLNTAAAAAGMQKSDTRITCYTEVLDDEEDRENQQLNTAAAAARMQKSDTRITCHAELCLKGRKSCGKLDRVCVAWLIMYMS